VSILDIIPLELPEYRQTGVKARTFFTQAKWCKGVAVLSQHTADRVHGVLGVPEDRIVVCPLPIIVSDENVHLADGCRVNELPDAFVSSVLDLRTVDPRKRAQWLLSSAAALRPYGVPLVLVGNGTDAINVENVIGLGRLCDLHLREVLGRATCFLYTSAYEGQGLPPQESLAMGTPVVSLRNSSLPEMLGPGALWVDEPVDRALDLHTLVADREERVACLVGEVLRFVHDASFRDATGNAGRAFVRAFTEERFVETMRQFYDRSSHA
jgi:glycosyltransferase involved in cell wall biosynthesis